jgi:hypothetical protein
MNRIELITIDCIRRLENNITIPGWLEKQKNAIEMIADDNRKGIYLLIEGLTEEKEWITSLLTSAELLPQLLET